MSFGEIKAELKRKHGIEQTPADWLNEFDTREEAWDAWLDSMTDNEIERVLATFGE
jgi:hypothetical protein